MSGDGIRTLFQMSGMSLSEVAKALGKSKATVSQAINGKYKGKKEVIQEVRAVIEARIERAAGAGIAIDGGKTADEAACGEKPQEDSEDAQGGKNSEPEAAPGDAGEGSAKSVQSAPVQQTKPSGQLLTPGQKQAWVLMELVRRQSDFAVLIGSSGVGKTWVARRYRQEFAADLYTAKLGQSPGALLSALCRTWNLSPDGGNDVKLDRLMRAARGRFLIVDEADLLIGNRTRRHVLRLVEIFRQIYEAGAGVVLVGLPVLHRALSEAGETYVFSRIGYLRQLGEPSEDFLAMHWRRLVGSHARAVEKTGPVVAQARRGGFFRYLEKLADLVNLLGGDVEEALGLMFRPEIA